MATPTVPSIGRVQASHEAAPRGADSSSARALAAILALAGALGTFAPPAAAIEAAGSPHASAVGAAAPIVLEEAVLVGVQSGRIVTSSASYALAPGCALYLRSGGSIRAIETLSGHVGKRLQLKLVDGRAAWVVVESEEKLQ